ncbi:MAG: ATP-binding protein [Sphingobacteriaceae bacterium]|nr:ATP-binding protein [Sphingobacteriaceae bacterium]
MPAEDTLAARISYIECLMYENPTQAMSAIKAYMTRKDVLENKNVYRTSQFLYANILLNQSEFEQALVVYDTLNARAEAEEDYYRKAYVALNKGIIYRRMGQHGKCLEEYVKGLEAARKCEHTGMQATVLQNMGVFYNTIEQFENAITSLKEAFQLYAQDKNERGKAMVAANLGISLKNLGQTDSALVYYIEAASSFEKEGDFYNLAKMKSNIGQLYMAVEGYGPAAVYLEEAITMMEKQNNYSDLINTLNAQADLLIRQAKFDAAQRSAARAAALAEEKQSWYGARNAYAYLATAQEKLGNYKAALDAHRKSVVFNDSLNSEEQQELLAEMQAKYEAEKKDLELLAKDNELALQSAQLKLVNYTSLLLLLVIGILAFNFVRIRKLNRLLSTQGALLADKNQALASMGDFKDRLLTIISHDVRNPLTGLKSILALQASGAISQEEFDEWNIEATKRIDAALSMLGNLLEWSKSQLVGLKPFVEEFSGELFMRELIEQVQYQAALKGVTLKWEVAPTLICHTDRHMLRTSAYNLINNAIKFSDKTEVVHIELRKQGGELLLRVVDQGIGMSAEQLERVRNPQDIYTTYGTENEKGTGIGLVLAYDLVATMGGRIEVQSTLGEGSTFTVFLPH